MNRIQKSIHITQFGPWMRAAVDKAYTSEAYTVFQLPDLITHPTVKGFALRQPSWQDGYSRMIDGTLGMLYKGDTVVLSTAKPTAGPGDTTPKKFSVEIGNRVKGDSGSESAPTWDNAGYTWRGICDAYIGHLTSYLASAPRLDSSATLPVTNLKKPNADGMPVDDMVNGKYVRMDESFFESTEYEQALTQASTKLRAGALEPAPAISPRMWSKPAGEETYWDATIAMEWMEAPMSRVDTEIPTTWLESETEYRVYANSTANAIIQAYETVRDAHNAKLEAALLNASKGNAMSAGTELELKTRPGDTTHPLIKKEADEWWNKVNTLTHEVKKVGQVTDVTDSNLPTKFPKGAGGMTLDELDAHIKAKRALGDTTTTKEIIDALTAPENQKTNQPWWHRVLDTVDGFGAGTKEVLTSWGPMGTVGVYGGVKAVDGASSGNSNWLWIALAAGAAILLLK